MKEQMEIQCHIQIPEITDSLNNILPFLFSDSITSFFDLWMVGDTFLKDTFNTLQMNMNTAQENRKLPKYYIQEFYNVHKYADNPGLKDSKIAVILNQFIKALDEHQKLPRFLIVMIDKDLLEDLDLFATDALQAIRSSVDWLDCN